MVFCKRLTIIMLSIFILSVVLFVYLAVVNPAFSLKKGVAGIGIAEPDLYYNDPIIKFLGKNFEEIKLALGEPDEQGYSAWLGPHYFIHFRQKDGFIRFCSPEQENEIVVSIILGQDQGVLGVKVGMPFPDIQSILGEPHYGPEIGGDDLYYMDYFLGEIRNGTPEILLSFIADAIHSPTHEAFVKRESFEQGEEVNVNKSLKSVSRED